MKRSWNWVRSLGKLAMAGGLMAAPVSQAQTLLQITSPSDGSIVQQGQTVTVTFTADPSVSNIALVASFPVGFVGQTSSAGTFMLPVPATTPINEYQVYVTGTAAGQTVTSAAISLEVDTPYSIELVETVPSTLQFEAVGDSLQLAVTGTLSNGSTANVTYSPQITYSSTNTSVVTVDRRGNVMAVAAGNAFVTITGGSAPYNVYANVAVAPVATPTFSPAGGTYSGAQKVTISDAATGAAIYYTMDGSAPTAQSTVYSAPVSVSSSQTINAIAILSGQPNSVVGAASYLIKLPTTLALTSNPNPADQGAVVTLTATLTPYLSGSQSTDGDTITFSSGTTTLGTGTLKAGVATLQVSTLAAGTDAITASYPGDPNFGASAALAITQTVVAPSFSINFNPASASVAAGAPATSIVSVASVGGFNQEISFDCAGLPPYATCGFSPVTITPTKDGTLQTTLTIATNVPSVERGNFRGASGLPLAYPALGVLTLVLVGRRRSIYRNGFFGVLFCAALLVILATGLMGCGGGGGGGETQSTPTTPSGTYTVTVKAMASASSQTSAFSLTVN